MVILLELIIPDYVARNHEISPDYHKILGIKSSQNLNSDFSFTQKMKTHILEESYIVCENPCPSVVYVYFEMELKWVIH